MRTSAWRLAVYAMIVVAGALTALPNFLSPQQLTQWPDWLPKQHVTLGLDLRGGMHLVLELDAQALIKERVQARGGQAATKAESDAWVAAASEQSLEIVRVRIDELGLAEASVQRAGPDRIVVQLPGEMDRKRVGEVLQTTAKLSFRMVRQVDGPLPPGVSFREGLNSGERYAVEDRVMLSGERLTDARLSFDGTTNEPVVSFTFDAEGARKFGAITQANVGRPFAVMLDDNVLTAPVIEQPIVGGTGQIKGSFTAESASDLAALLRAGALPVKLTIVEERTVGPDVGDDAIEGGITTGLLGFGLVVGFVVTLYGAWGVVANAALVLNALLTLAALSLLGATLTLPGIAGMVLSIGLAVDANVLINERIREETRKGLGAMAALDAGFRRASATIIDSNLTALIATALLFLFGSGPVRGFAVTIGLGIAISMFTAVTIVRLVMIGIVQWRRLKTLRIEPLFRLKLVPDGTAIPFMRARFLGLAVSALLSCASVGLLFTPGLNYGVDFKGGVMMEIVTAKPTDLGALRAGLQVAGFGDAALQTAGDATHILVRAPVHAGGEDLQRQSVNRLSEALVRLSPGAAVEKVEVVGPKVSGELATTGVLAVVLACLAMLAYIWVRFQWPFAVGAIATLVLDVTKTAGFMALTGLEFNLTAIAALLTLIGYSVNDKVVVYDRMRENLRLYKSVGLREIIDRSINETLGRSLYASATALVSLLPMAIWGGSAVESFAVPMVFGILVAASSSVFIAAPILLFLGDWRRKRRGALVVEALAASP
ncbi:MAG: protein translocase subunit SecD [Alphaproteobacteria bacterium]|nr:protein translocase subunit SecD [Alphaproteobacteria bacterium]